MQPGEDTRASESKQRQEPIVARVTDLIDRGSKSHEDQSSSEQLGPAGTKDTYVQEATDDAETSQGSVTSQGPGVAEVWTQQSSGE